MRRKLFTHYFPSGNNVDVYIEGDPTPVGVKTLEVQWEHFPPSKRDIKRYMRDIPPRVQLEFGRLFGDGSVKPPKMVYAFTDLPDDLVAGEDDAASTVVNNG